jgi:hypothetical protein
VTAAAELAVEIVGTELPGRRCGVDAGVHYGNIHVGIQRGKEPIDYVAGDAAEARWRFGATVKEAKTGLDLSGPYIQGRPGDRFIYLSWLEVSDGFAEMFRRAKLMLTPAGPAITQAVAEGKALRGELGLTDAKGNPRCAAVRPPVITWSAV